MKEYYEVVDSTDGNIIDRFSAADTTEAEVLKFAECAVVKEADYACYDVYYVTEEIGADGEYHVVDDNIIACFDNKEI